MAPRVLVADSVARDGIELLRTQTEVDDRAGIDADTLMSIIGDYDGLVVRSRTRVTAAVIEAGRKLQVIGRAGVGVDNIDLDAATQRGIVVVNAPAGNTIAAAEHAIALMLALARNIPQANASLKSGIWSPGAFMGLEVRNKTLGILGLGRVGSEVARRARGLDMSVIANDPYVSAEHARNLNVELVSLEELLRRSDFITFHTPLTATTRGMVGPQELTMVKPSVRIINCARGGIIDEQALFEAVEAGRVAGAAIDVFSEEPAVDNILTKSDRIIVTPHLGASTSEAQVNVAVDVAEQVLAVLFGRPASYAVNTPFISSEAYPVVAPFIEVARYVGLLASQLAEGQRSAVSAIYEGDIARYDTTPLTAAILRGLLEGIGEERVNLVNAERVARSRGLRVREEKSTECENYGNLITGRLTTDRGETTVAGTLMRGEVHLVMVSGLWLDVVPSGGHVLFIDHRDRPGLIGAVGNVTGRADINISYMQVGREAPRGRALMALGLDEVLLEEQRQEILAIPDIYTAKLVTL